MGYTINYLEGVQVVEVVFTGRMNFKIAEQYSKEAIKIARENNCHNFLIDHTKTKSNVNIHSTGEELQQFGFDITDRIAIVFKHGRSSDLVSQNSRWCESKYFGNASKAVNWLTT
jgi:Cft2 family RNA processing exonuclease